jgi:hypothetical protein
MAANTGNPAAAPQPPNPAVPPAGHAAGVDPGLSVTLASLASLVASMQSERAADRETQVKMVEAVMDLAKSRGWQDTAFEEDAEKAQAAAIDILMYSAKESPFFPIAGSRVTSTTDNKFMSFQRPPLHPAAAG